MSARLGVQLVTYRNGFDQLLRTLRGVEATVAKARAAQLVGDVTVRMGDCAEHEWYSADELGRFAAAVPSASLSYRSLQLPHWTWGSAPSARDDLQRGQTNMAETYNRSETPPNRLRCRFRAGITPDNAEG